MPYMSWHCDHFELDYNPHLPASSVIYILLPMPYMRWLFDHNELDYNPHLPASSVIYAAGLVKLYFFGCDVLTCLSVEVKAESLWD